MHKMLKRTSNFLVIDLGFVIIWKLIKFKKIFLIEHNLYQQHKQYRLDNNRYARIKRKYEILTSKIRKSKWCRILFWYFKSRALRFITRIDNLFGFRSKPLVLRMKLFDFISFFTRILLNPLDFTPKLINFIL